MTVLAPLIVPDLAEFGIVLALGLLFGLASRQRFRVRWLIAGVLLIEVNNLLLSRLYHLLPNFIPGQWNWTGKALAVAATLAIAALPPFRWRRAGLRLAQRPGSVRAAVPITLLYCLYFLVIAITFGSDRADGQTIAFQLTMPGLEEEPFYRGLLLLCFDHAFRGRVRFLGVEWGWASVLSCTAFGLAHALGFADGRLTFDFMTIALTGIPAFVGVWLRYRTGSVLLPILIHNFGNAIGLLV